MVVVAILFVLLLTNPVRSQPQTNIVIQRCSQINATNLLNFFRNLNETFGNVRRQLSNDNTYFATAEQTRNSEPVYVFGQCRKYMSTRDCVACFDYADKSIRSCAAANGARTVLDGCYLRYASNSFYDQTTLPTYSGLSCGNRTSSRQSVFETSVDGLLSNLSIATPKISGFYAAATAPVAGTNTSTVYAIAQCVERITRDGCKDCLQVAYANIKSCATDVTDGRAFDSGCFMRYSASAFFANNKTMDITPFLQDDETPFYKNITNFLKGHAGALGGGGGLFFLVLVLWLFYYLRQKSKKTKEGKGPRILEQVIFIHNIWTLLHGPCDTLDTPEMKGAVNYDYKYLQLATNNFSEENIIGKGGFGEVFKANLDDNKVVAVKKLKVRYARAKVEFENEVLLTSHIRHRNLLCLLGCSSDVSNLLLILEYMPNGSLDKFLWGTKKGTLNWRQRYDIIFGIARGLAHLHKEFHAKIIHRDIKSSNILLDDNFQPKIADFGLARFQPKDQTHVITKFGGTLGYIAPEYALHGHLTEKVDTFSFGIVILEIISGRKCTDITTSTDYLLEHAWKLYENNEHMKLIDETMDANQYEKEHVMKIIEIALLCTQSPISRRPDMSEVVPILPNAQAMAKREIIRPIFMDLNRRVHIDDSKNCMGIGNVQLHSEKTDDEGDVMEKGMNGAKNQ